MDKIGKRTTPRTVLTLGDERRKITVPGSDGHRVKAALENVRSAVSDKSFARQVRDANDVLDDESTDFLLNEDASQLEENNDEDIKHDENRLASHLKHVLQNIMIKQTPTIQHNSLRM